MSYNPQQERRAFPHNFDDNFIPEKRMGTRSEFAVHRLNEDGLKKAEEIGVLFTDFLNDLESTIGTAGREAAIVRTKLEEASFFAKKALAVNPVNQL